MHHPAIPLLCLFALFHYTTPASPPVPCPPREQSPEAVDVLFVLDTTGSMGSMIEDAKTTIWSIANEVVALAGNTRLRFGVVFFRDRGDRFVTRRVPLSTELDRVYAHLLEMRAEGGGDGPESVNQALAEALVETDWSSAADAERMIFLVGDAPPHDDYGDDTPWPATCEAARTSLIPIHTIRYSAHPTTMHVWSEIAQRTGGVALAVAQTTASTDRSTPFDFQLARHSKLLDEAVLAYGDPSREADEVARRERVEAIERDSSEAALADRATYRGSAAGRDGLAGRDLIADLLAGRVELDALSDAELPGVLRDLDPEAQRRYLDDRIEQRRGILSEIAHYSEKRSEHLEKRHEDERPDFDSAIGRALRCRLAASAE